LTEKRKEKTDDWRPLNYDIQSQFLILKFNLMWTMECTVLCSNVAHRHRYKHWHDTNTDDTKIRIIFKMYDTETRIYILHNYEFYKLTINIYVHKYVSYFFLGTWRCFSWLIQKNLFLVFIIIIKNYIINLSFKKIIVFIFF